MKNVLLFTLFLVGTILSYSSGLSDKEATFFNDEVFSFEIESSTPSEFLNIIFNGPRKPVLVKIIDKSGFIRIEKRMHLDTQIDLSILRTGLYLVKVYSGNQMAVKRFYKGRDAINIR
ncbi:T9SS type A sorting domain-containing protein [Aquimarina sp. MMG016]|uniref:T9SS type A sorting domain-containing protein n=1 Tax=Aquimarina sp. MMG016 TaxID=2822690 RepID=UPI001B3A2D6B|nr:T9SS type A sorting domain-containing protein [Aquimarina sp. MMG016]MBQ4821761.1 T9SS type A sorting domain-containing protein [Aquimarina sp. MMG016]